MDLPHRQQIRLNESPITDAQRPETGHGIGRNPPSAGCTPERPDTGEHQSSGPETADDAEAECYRLKQLDQRIVPQGDVAAEEGDSFG